ncbi:MAG TPA: long-chain fatty acid--CoA ligase, partial [Acidimicrobiales bacterium]|nr:long-chain fatty acid--CoA ligase [Acidimicrobiales bacterium]
MLFHRLLLDGADRHPDRPAFTWVDRNRTMTYEEAATEMDQVAGALASLGVSRLDRVGVFAYNGLDYLLAMFGAWRLGAISALVNVQYADTLDYFVNDATPSVLIYTHDQLPAIERHRPALPSVEHYICLDGPQPGALSWPDLLEGASAPPPDVTREDDPAHLSYTSGTSGRPKGALLAHEPTTRATNCIAERLRIDSSDVLFGPTALSSSYQLVANLLPGLHRGCHVHVMGKWEAASGWQALDTARATVFAANPTLLTDVLVQSRALRRVPCAVRVGLSGGGPVPPSLKRAWRDELCLPLVESYGQSELGGFVALGQPKLVDSAHLSAIGRSLPDKEVRILDDDDREVPMGDT